MNTSRPRMPEDSARRGNGAGPGRPFLRALVPVAVSYGLAAAGTFWWPSDLLRSVKQDPLPPWIGLPVILLFTATHAVVPAFFYRPFVAVAQATRIRALGCFTYVHMGFWYGLPMLVLAAITGWLGLIGVVVHLALARRGTRTWVFFEYGSTAVSLLLLLAVTAMKSPLLWDVPVALGQILLLTFMEVKARPLWTTESPPPPGPPA